MAIAVAPRFIASFSLVKDRLSPRAGARTGNLFVETVVD
jgi:hypothetical protein